MNNRMLSTTPGAQTLLRPPPRDQPRRVTQRDRAELQVSSSGHSCSDLEPDSSSGCRSHGRARELGVLGVTTGCLGSGVTDSTTPRPRAACSLVHLDPKLGLLQVTHEEKPRAARDVGGGWVWRPEGQQHRGTAEGEGTVGRGGGRDSRVVVES